MADDFDRFEQYLRQFQPRRPPRPLPASRLRWRVAKAPLAAAAVLLVAVVSAAGWLMSASPDGGASRGSARRDAQSAPVERRLNAGRLTRAALDPSRNIDDVLASVTADTLTRVERAGGPLHSLARE